MNARTITARALATGIIATTAAFGMAGTADAVSQRGCRATPLTPTFAGINPAGKKVLKYTVRVTCAANRTVVLQQQVKERDTFLNPDDLVRSRTLIRTFVVAGSKTVSLYQATPNTEPGNEEMFHQVRIRVSIGGGPFGAYSAWDKSAVVSVNA